MAVNLNHSNSTSGVQDPLVTFRQYIQTRISDNYCSTSEYQSIVKHGVDTIQLELQKAEFAVDLQLEQLGVANELRLLQELESALQQFTVSDKKLDAKEKSDAFQLVCKARPGFRHGLKYDVAESTIITYCRTHGVKVKTGVFSWSVP